MQAGQTGFKRELRNGWQELVRCAARDSWFAGLMFMVHMTEAANQQGHADSHEQCE